MRYSINMHLQLVFCCTESEIIAVIPFAELKDYGLRIAA